MKKIYYRLLAAVAMLVLFVSCIPVYAATPSAMFSMKVMEFDIVSNTYKEQNTFYPGSTLVVAISVSGIDTVSVRGNSLTMQYDDTKLKFQSDSSICCVSDEKSELYANAKDGGVKVWWDTTAKDTKFNGTVYYLKFDVIDTLGADVQAKFTMTIDELYESANGFPKITAYVSQPEVAVSLKAETIDEKTMKLFNALEVVDTESLDAIVSAMNAYSKLTSGQKSYFYTYCRKQYDWLSTAYDRYYKALEAAGAAEVDKLVADFHQVYDPILNKELSDVTLEDADIISQLNIAYAGLPTTVTSRLGETVKEKVAALVEKVQLLNDAISEIEEFRNTYSSYCEITNEAYENDYERFYVYIDEALMIYDMLSEEAQAGLKTEYLRLQEIKEIIERKLAEDEAEAVLRGKVNEFQKKWMRIFTLTTGDVSVNDKTAIQMAMADYQTLDKDVQERLKGRYTMLESLLKIIDSMGSGNDSGVIDVPGQTVTVTKTIIKEITKETQETLGTINAMQTFTPAIYILLGLLALSILMLGFPLGLQIKCKKEEKKHA